MYIAFGLISSTVYLFLADRENRRRDRGERDEVIGAEGSDEGKEGDEGKKGGHARNGVYESVDAARRDKGDEWSGYRYTL